jgi:putative FmdB family regulatory protein
VPTYDFKCQKCGQVSEGFKRMSDPCPPCECGGETTVHFGGAAPKAHFAGGGWAADNYSTVRKRQTVGQMLDRSSR